MTLGDFIFKKAISCFNQCWKSAVGLNFSILEKKVIERSHPKLIIIIESSKAGKDKILLTWTLSIWDHATTDVLTIQPQTSCRENESTWVSTARRGKEEARKHKPLPSGSSSGDSTPLLHSPT